VTAIRAKLVECRHYSIEKRKGEIGEHHLDNHGNDMPKQSDPRDQYDALAGRSEEINGFLRFYRERVEFPSFLRALGSVSGKRVLDVGCGEGVYARLAKQKGAAHVEGVDVSGGLIGIAQSVEDEQPMGISYHVHHAAHMPMLGDFDVAIAVNVLHYAESLEVLSEMCERIAAHLVPGGRLLAYVGNAKCDPGTVADLGFSLDLPPDAEEGDPFTVSIRSTPPASVSVRYWKPQTVARAVKASGFTDVKWEPMVAEPTAGDDTELLERCAKSPISLLLSARKL